MRKKFDFLKSSKILIIYSKCLKIFSGNHQVDTSFYCLDTPRTPLIYNKTAIYNKVLG